MTEGYLQKQFNQPTKRYCQTLELKDDAELIRRYREAHDPDHFWDEIKAGIRAVGILEMEIYIAGNRLIMIVDAPADFCWDEAMSRLATLPRQQEWEQYVAAFQQCAADATSNEKWQMMERMFRLYE
ncbi:MAG: L-rhamnose mutarotase [Prevotella sp.]|nr:L-rhamnose mutarotase [Prevotella sp.]